MKIKNSMIIVSVLLNIVLALLLYQETTRVNPIEVGLLFKEEVRVENYERAKKLMAEGSGEHISDETLKKINEATSARTSYKTYELLEFDNGEMVLLNLTPDENYEIQDAIIVPDEFKAIFKLKYYV